MTTLHLGVVDIPYVEGPAPLKKLVQRVGRRKDRTHDENTEGLGPEGGVTTGDVATFLENKYHVMESFYELHGQGIADDLADSLQGALETILQGGPMPVDPYAAGTAQIENRFREFLSSGEIEQLGIPGVPTKAALEGRSKRFKSGRNPKGRRPSFIDSGLYESAERAWVVT